MGLERDARFFASSEICCVVASRLEWRSRAERDFSGRGAQFPPEDVPVAQPSGSGSRLALLAGIPGLQCACSFPVPAAIHHPPSTKQGPARPSCTPVGTYSSASLQCTSAGCAAQGRSAAGPLDVRLARRGAERASLVLLQSAFQRNWPRRNRSKSAGAPDWAAAGQSAVARRSESELVR